ncbi:MAG: mechanosensitive ion channel family protein [Bacilli bacterium]|nr:mechanosensitive ion channel family protein [Bacilli bacterium]
MILANNLWGEMVNALKNFGKSIVDFFMVENNYGLSLLSRIILSILIIVLGSLAIKLLLKILRRASGIKKGITRDLSAKSFFLSALQIFLYLALAFIVIGVLGFDVSNAVGLLSAVTVALGLALQDIIGMFASGILILNTKNFKTGDYIKVVNSIGEESGQVFQISLLYTTLLNVDGQKIYIPNNNITKANVTNYTDFNYRRASIDIVIPYSYNTEKVKKLLLKVAKDEKRVLDNPASSAVVSDYKEIGAIYTLRCYIPTDLYWDTMLDIRSSIIDELNKNNIKVSVSNELQINEKK